MLAIAYKKTHPSIERLSCMVKILFSRESFLLPVSAFNRGHMEEIQSQASERSHPVFCCSAKTPTEGHPRGPSLLLFLTVQSLPMFFLGSELCSGELWDNSSGPIDLCRGEGGGGWSWTCKILQDRPLPVSGTRWNTFSCKGFQHGGFCRHACSHTSSTSPERGEEAVTCHCKQSKEARQPSAREDPRAQLPDLDGRTGFRHQHFPCSSRRTQTSFGSLRK